MIVTFMPDRQAYYVLPHVSHRWLLISTCWMSKCTNKWIQKVTWLHLEAAITMFIVILSYILGYFEERERALFFLWEIYIGCDVKWLDAILENWLQLQRLFH